MNNENDNLINKIVYLMQTDKSADAPTDSIKWAKNIFRSRVAEPKKSLVQKVLAVLQMDLAPNKTVFGERSASASQARQMLFGAGDNQIDLRIETVKKGFNIKGQILGEGFENAEIKLENAENSFIANINELSEFKLANVAKGNYQLTLTSQEKNIIIENLEII